MLVMSFKKQRRRTKDCLCLLQNQVGCDGWQSWSCVFLARALAFALCNLESYATRVAVVFSDWKRFDKSQKTQYIAYLVESRGASNVSHAHARAATLEPLICQWSVRILFFCYHEEVCYRDQPLSAITAQKYAILKATGVFLVFRCQRQTPSNS